MDICIRELQENEFDKYKSIRLELLQKEPTSFGSSFGEENLFEDDLWKKRISKETVSTFGAFDHNNLIGICVVVFNPRSKIKHIASLHSMYVKEAYRGKSIGKNLITYAEEVAKQKEVKRINLSVVEGNVTAKSLYKKLGYIEYGVELDTIKYLGKYYSLILLSKLI